MERVILGRRQLDKIISEKIPVYDAKMEGGEVFVDQGGHGFLSIAGGIDAGETGHISGSPIKVYKSTLKMIDKSEIMGGNETTNAFPIHLDRYNRVVWVPSDFIHMI
jgi:hypothetical protein